MDLNYRTNLLFPVSVHQFDVNGFNEIKNQLIDYAYDLKKKDPEPWRHVFSIIYYGFGDANRYTYYAKSNKIKQVFLSKVRNQNGLSREEFDSLPARDLQGMISDPVLVKFVFENRNYSLEQTVAIVKRIKVWGRT